jgi:hypothetical protein
MLGSQSENLKVIFFESASDGKAGRVIADGYFSFVPTFTDGETINVSVSRKESANTAPQNPIGHKTHRIMKTDWIFTVDERSKKALATLVVSVEKISAAVPTREFPNIVGTHD